jgi:flagellar protein FlaI
MYDLTSLLTRLLECIECRYSCRDKGLCVFSKEEIDSVVALASRIFRRDLDAALQTRYELFTKIDEEIALKATLATMGLLDVAEFVEDEEVEDILLIPGRPIYVTTKSGKYKTSKVAEMSLIRSLLSLAQMKGVELTTANTSLRYGLTFGKIRVRISLDIPPIVPNPQAYIRIHRGKITIRQLLENGFMTHEQLRQIYSELKEGKHTVVKGRQAAARQLCSLHLTTQYRPTYKGSISTRQTSSRRTPTKTRSRL